jgi:UDP-2-acetamido-3-amino-2,3-dideoxy-glucuronate N-acetyltransferase
MQIHPAAIVESTQIGAGTRIWAIAHILPGAHIGREYNICHYTFIVNNVTHGDRVTVKSGVHLWHGLSIEKSVSIGSILTALPVITEGNRAKVGAVAFVTRNLQTDSIASYGHAPIASYVGNKPFPALPGLSPLTAAYPTLATSAKQSPTASPPPNTSAANSAAPKSNYCAPDCEAIESGAGLP